MSVIHMCATATLFLQMVFSWYRSSNIEEMEPNSSETSVMSETSDGGRRTGPNTEANTFAQREKVKRLRQSQRAHRAGQAEWVRVARAERVYALETPQRLGT